MGFLVLLTVVVLVFIVGGLFAWQWITAERAERGREQARLKIIESQLAALRAVLRIGQAEHRTRQRMQAELHRDVFANPTTYQEPDEWR